MSKLPPEPEPTFPINPKFLKKKLIATDLKARYVLYLVYIKRYTQSQAAVLVELSVGTVCHIVHGRRFPGSTPTQFPGT